MYSYEDKMRALELYLMYDRSAAAAINELGYPNRHRSSTTFSFGSKS